MVFLVLQPYTTLHSAQRYYTTLYIRQKPKLDCRTRMAGSIFYLAPVDNASGKIFGKKQKFVAVRRKQGKRQRGCAVMGERTTPYGANEIAWQEKFAQICAATRERMIDPNHVAQDQADFAAQSKYKTFYQYVWNLMRDQIESGQ